MTDNVIYEDTLSIIEELKDLLPKISGKTILISGGAGFLGRYILEVLNNINQRYLKEQCRIIVVDNFITGIKFSIKESKNLILIERDIKYPLNIDEKIDYILHAAGIASPVFYSKYPLETIDVNTLGTKNILELALDKKVKSIVHFSSSEIYGDPDPKFIPTPETYNGNVSCTGLRACYDESKRLAETLCMTYFRKYQLPIKIVRLFNVYGPGLRKDDGRVVSSFIFNALNKKDIEMFTGNSTRAFCYISDAVIGILRLLFSDLNGEVVNIGNPTEEITISELAKKIINKFDNQIKLITHDAVGVYNKDNPKRRCPDIKKAQNLLGYQPKINLDQGLDKFIRWAKENWK
ncbi:MAG: NAD-dependent epimerase/dehydratase family protein [Candidatus Parvarchaeota archaeon]